jgi:hypothetical protein
MRYTMKRMGTLKLWVLSCSHPVGFGCEIGGYAVKRLEHKADYSVLLAGDEEQLYRNLSDPDEWPLPPYPAWDMPSQIHRGRISSIPEFTAEEIRRQRQWRADEHRRVASDLRKWAAIEADDDRRAKLVGAAQLNEGLAQTLDSLIAEELFDEAEVERLDRE